MREIKTVDLGDFNADRRLMLAAAMAVVVGTGGAAAAWGLSHLINAVTNLAYLGKFSDAPVSIGGSGLGWQSVLIPVAGCIIIGLMARYGSEKIRGHGIPEAIEAILLGSLFDGSHGGCGLQPHSHPAARRRRAGGHSGPQGCSAGTRRRGPQRKSARSPHEDRRAAPGPPRGRAGLMSASRPGCPRLVSEVSPTF
jgi:hypothetical protein